MKKRIITGIVLLVIIFFATAFYAYLEFNRKVKTVASLKSDFIVTTSDFIKEFESNETTAGKKYVQKTLELKGILSKIEKDSSNNSTLILKTDGSHTSIRCSLDSSINNKQNTIEGTIITVKGICTGFNADELGLGADIVLNRCIIISN